jgi:hypothetical protein
MTPTSQIVPIDLIFKMPFRVSDVIEPYVGIGPALSLEHEEGETFLFPGVIATTGRFCGSTATSVWIWR